MTEVRTITDLANDMNWNPSILGYVIGKLKLPVTKVPRNGKAKGLTPSVEGFVKERLAPIASGEMDA